MEQSNASKEQPKRDQKPTPPKWWKSRFTLMLSILLSAATTYLGISSLTGFAKFSFMPALGFWPSLALIVGGGIGYLLTGGALFTSRNREGKTDPFWSIFFTLAAAALFFTAGLAEATLTSVVANDLTLGIGTIGFILCGVILGLMGAGLYQKGNVGEKIEQPTILDDDEGNQPFSIAKALGIKVVKRAPNKLSPELEARYKDLTQIWNERYTARSAALACIELSLYGSNDPSLRNEASNLRTKLGTNPHGADAWAYSYPHEYDLQILNLAAKAACQPALLISLNYLQTKPNQETVGFAATNGYDSSFVEKLKFLSNPKTPVPQKWYTALVWPQKSETKSLVREPKTASEKLYRAIWFEENLLGNISAPITNYDPFNKFNSQKTGKGAELLELLRSLAKVRKAEVEASSFNPQELKNAQREFTELAKRYQMTTLATRAQQLFESDSSKASQHTASPSQQGPSEEKNSLEQDGDSPKSPVTPSSQPLTSPVSPPSSPSALSPSSSSSAASTSSSIQKEKSSAGMEPADAPKPPLSPKITPIVEAKTLPPIVLLREWIVENLRTNNLIDQTDYDRLQTSLKSDRSDAEKNKELIAFLDNPERLNRNLTRHKTRLELASALLKMLPHNQEKNHEKIGAMLSTAEDEDLDRNLLRLAIQAKSEPMVKGVVEGLRVQIEDEDIQAAQAHETPAICTFLESTKIDQEKNISKGYSAY